jgi:putative peptidoglycan lipid II flippase
MNLSWLIKAESYKRGMVLSVVFNVIAKFLLFLLTICIARLFGTNIKTDIYFFIYSSMVLFSGSINAVDTAVIIPESMHLREAEGKSAAIGFLNYFMRIYFITGILFIALIAAFGTTIFAAISKFSEPDIITYKNYFLIGSFYLLFQLLINYCNTILISLKFFTVPMMISCINSCIVIAGSLLLYKQYDILSVLLSGLAAYFINLIFLVYLLKKNADWNFSICKKIINKKIWSKLFFSELGQLATLASSYFPLFLLSGFNSGVISAMNYGKNIADIPNTLLTAQVANVSGIKMNEQVAKNEQDGLNDTFIKSAKLLVFILVPVGAYMFVFAQPLIELFYKTGNFTAAAVASSAKFLQLLAITIFSIGVNAMVTRIFIAMQIIKQALFYKIIMNGLLIIAIWIFSGYYGAYGYPYGVIFMNSLNFLGMFFICRKFFKSIQYGQLLQYTAAIILIHLPVAAILFYTFASGNLYGVYKLLIGCCIYIAMMLLINRFKMIKIL